MIGQKILDILSKHNLKKIHLEKNEVFDLEKHEAISSLDVKDKKQKGGALSKRIIVEQFKELVDG